ncbi:MAG: membrane protein insertion efficiency factor YidD [Chloroflexota bacterium]|nr:membrane protein insertion efficiency factor YidD [Chloroflexota bacterium]
MKGIALRLIQLYQGVVSPFRPPSCRFVPSCSRYGCQAIDKFGLWQGSWLTLWRLVRCHPFSRGGYDPVPSK